MSTRILTRGTQRFELTGEPSIRHADGSFLVTFSDPHDAPSYVRGVLWICERDGRIVWTEGVRKAPGLDTADLDGMHLPARIVYSTTVAMQTAGHRMPRLETVRQ